MDRPYLRHVKTTIVPPSDSDSSSPEEVRCPASNPSDSDSSCASPEEVRCPASNPFISSSEECEAKNDSADSSSPDSGPDSASSSSPLAASPEYMVISSGSRSSVVSPIEMASPTLKSALVSAATSTPLTSPSLDSTSALVAGLESLANVSTQTDVNPPPCHDLVNARRNIYSDLEWEDCETESSVQMPPDLIHDRERDLSLLPQSLARAYRRIRPIPAGLTPPRMPRITNFAWRGAGDWTEAAGIGETIRTDSPWTSMEASVLDDIFRPVRSFADARFRLADQLHDFVDVDEDDSYLSVDSHGRCLTPLNWTDEMRPRGRARPDARPHPQSGSCPPYGVPLEQRKGTYKQNVISNFFIESF